MKNNEDAYISPTGRLSWASSHAEMRDKIKIRESRKRPVEPDIIIPHSNEPLVDTDKKES